MQRLGSGHQLVLISWVIIHIACTRMRMPVHLLHAGLGNVRVDLSSGERGVT